MIIETAAGPISRVLGNGKFAGPLTLKFKENLGFVPALISYSITKPDQATNSNAVVIPDDNSGDHQVILEASTDMRNWVPVQPGSYPSTTTRRFFRVRIQKL